MQLCVSRLRLAGCEKGTVNNINMEELNNSMTQEEVIIELINLLKHNQMQDKENDVFELVSCIDGLQSKLDLVVGELNSVREQLANMEQKSLKDTLLEIVNKMESRCAEMKTQLLVVKESVQEKASEIVASVKRKGKEALNRVSEFCGIKDKLVLMRENVRESVADVNRTVAKIDTFGTGIREANQKIANTFRSFADKEIADYSIQEKPFSKSEMIKKPWQMKVKLLNSMELRLNAAIDRIDNLARDMALKQMEKKWDELNEKSHCAIKVVKGEVLPLVSEQKYEYGSESFEIFQQGQESRCIVQPLTIEALPEKEGRSR